jgi:hypothetical protein
LQLAKFGVDLQLFSGVLHSYAVLLIEKKDQEGQSQVLSAALEVCFNDIITQLANVWIALVFYFYFLNDLYSFLQMRIIKIDA